MRHVLFLCLLAISSPLFAQKAGEANTPPLVSVDITRLPEGATLLDLWLLCGQSNTIGRGFMPEEQKNAPRIVMLHKMDDQWYLARHPLHLVGDARTYQVHDNAGRGPGLRSAQVMAGPCHEKAVAHTACIDPRDLTTHIGDSVHFVTAAPIGRRSAAKFMEPSKP